MLARSIPTRAFVHSRIQPVGAASVRRLSVAPRLSAVALGKRPALPARNVLALGSVGASRNISWWGSSSTPAAAAAPPTPSTPTPTPTAAVDAQAPPAVETAAINTPVPSSDIPSIPAETPLRAPDHLTSTAPDHQFHSDPTPLLPQYPANAQTPTLEDLITNSGLPLDQVLNSPEAVHAAMKASDLKLMGLDHGIFSIPGWLRDSLVGMHEITGLPWWASIMALTLTLRMTLFPMVIKNLKHNVRFGAVTEQFQALMKRITEAKKENDQVALASASANLQTLMKTHDVSPIRPLFLPLMSVPLFLSMFYAIRKLAELPLPQLKEGGFSWVTDLTAPDPYYILPIASIALQLLSFKVGVDGTGNAAKASSARTMAHVRNFFLVTSPGLVLAVSYFPAAVLFYWTTANAFTLTQAFLLRQTFVRRIFGVVEPPKVKAPPEEFKVNPNPSIRESWQAMKDTHREMLAKTQVARELQTKAAIEREKAKSARSGTGMLAERVVEPAVKSSGFLEPDAPVSAGAGAETAAKVVPDTPEQRRARRLAAAREKRGRGGR